MAFGKQSRLVRVLLWTVVVCVPGGMILAAFLAADALNRRHRDTNPARRAARTEAIAESHG